MLPLDYLKCNLQANPICLKHIQIKNHIKTSLKAYHPVLIGHTFYEIYKFLLYDYLKKIFSATGNKNNTFFVYFKASILTEFYSTILLCPYETVKFKLYFRPDWSNLSVFQAMTRVIGEEGVSGLFYGLKPLLIRQILLMSTTFICYEFIKAEVLSTLKNKSNHKLSLNDLLFCYFLSGFISGTQGIILSHPADTVLSCLYFQNRNDYKKIIMDLGFFGAHHQILFYLVLYDILFF